MDQSALKFDLATEAISVQDSQEKILNKEELQANLAEAVEHRFDKSPQLDDSELTEEEKKAVEEFSEKIDLKDTDNILLYGSAAQKKIQEFSNTAIESVKNTDSGEVGDMLIELLGKLEQFNADTSKPRGIRGLFFNLKKHVENLKNRYSTVEANVDKIAENLEGHQIVLLKDIALFDKLYEKNIEYFKELSMYIMAGQKKLEKVREEELKPLQEKALKSGDQIMAQKVNDLAALCDRFEKKIHDLKLTRQVAMQMTPQIRLLQNNDGMLVERIQSALSNTLPLWKNQMVLALGLHRTEQALAAHKEVTDMTNTLLKRNAEKLKISTIETAKQSERGIIDIQTLTETNKHLIDTITEVMKIQKEGHQKRMAAEHELIRMENELKAKLLEIRK